LLLLLDKDAFGVEHYDRAFRAVLSEYERALCDVKDKYYKQYIVATGNRMGYPARDISS